MILLEYIKKWAQDKAGLLLSAHQGQRIIDQLNAYFINQNMTEKDFIHALSLKNKKIEMDFVNILTVQESYFFRDTSLFQFLENTHLPELIKQKTTNKDFEINVWSAGCSHGEEIYSVVILINQLIENISHWKLSFYATDINHQALATAKKAQYSKNGLRVSNQEFINKYFHKKANQFYLHENIKQQVNFDYFNLSNSPIPNIKFDLIFCRNVFIYLTQSTITRALGIFHEALKQQGILFLGPSDLVSHQSHDFDACLKNGTTILKKKSDNLCSLQSIHANKNNNVSYAEKQALQGKILRSIHEKMKKKEYNNALEEIDIAMTHDNSSALLLRYKGEALIHLGDIETAKAFLNKSIAFNRLDSKSYFLLALSTIDNPETSENLFKKAIFLNNEFFEAHYHLAMLYLSRKQVEKGLSYLLKSKKIAELKASNETLFCSNETTGNFLTSLNEEINHYQRIKNATE